MNSAAFALCTRSTCMLQLCCPSSDEFSSIGDRTSSNSHSLQLLSSLGLHKVLCFDAFLWKVQPEGDPKIASESEYFCPTDFVLQGHNGER